MKNPLNMLDKKEQQEESSEKFVKVHHVLQHMSQLKSKIDIIIVFSCLL